MSAFRALRRTSGKQLQFAGPWARGRLPASTVPGYASTASFLPDSPTFTDPRCADSPFGPCPKVTYKHRETSRIYSPTLRSPDATVTYRTDRRSKQGDAAVIEETMVISLAEPGATEG